MYICILYVSTRFKKKCKDPVKIFFDQALAGLKYTVYIYLAISDFICIPMKPICDKTSTNLSNFDVEC